MCPPSNLQSFSSTFESQQKGNETQSPSGLQGDSISQSAQIYAGAHLHPTILAHSLRVYHYANLISHHEENSPHTLNNTLLFVACIFHDMGTAHICDTSTMRFEVQGGDAAVKFLSNYAEVTAEQRHHVWTAIAVHTSPQIAERIHPLARLVRLAVKIDFKGSAEMHFLRGFLGVQGCEREITQLEKRLPRGSIEKILGDAVVDQAAAYPDKAPMVSWAGVMLKSKLDNVGWEGVNKAF